MGIADDLSEGGRVKRGRKHGATCTMSTLIDGLTPADREALEPVLKDDTWTGVEISQILRENGHSVGYWVVNRHRNGLCQCR